MNETGLAGVSPYAVIAGLIVVLNVVSYVAAVAVLWIGKRAIADLKSLQKAHAELEQSLPLIYLRRDDYREDITEIKTLLRDIFTKLDGKADRRRN